LLFDKYLNRQRLASAKKGDHGMKYFSQNCPDGIRLQTKRALHLKLPVQKIYWLSRHLPTTEQKKALILLHGENLQVITRDQNFETKAEFLTYLGSLSDGFIYVVAPLRYIYAASRAGHLIGEFCGHHDLLFGFELKCVFHYSFGSRDWKLGASEVADSGLIEIPYYFINKKRALALAS
jgi:hypothetical protein